MNENLLKSAKNLREIILNERRKLEKEYYANISVKEKNSIVKKVETLDDTFVRLNTAIKENNEETLIQMLNFFGIKYEEEKVNEPIVLNKENISKDKNSSNKFFIGLGTGLGLATVGFGIGSYLNNTGEVEILDDEENDLDDELINEEKPFEVYGEFNDSENEKQIQSRATWFYNKYVSENEGVNQIGLNDLINDIRMINGNFKHDGNDDVTYNATDISNTANDIFTIANYASFSQYGNQVKYVQYAPLFEDGSLAQKGAVILDNAMEKVISAIRADDTEAFMSAAKEWGVAVVNIFEYNDFNGNYPSIFQMEPYQANFLYKVMYGNYGPYILEYSQKHNLNICIPYCIDYNTHEIQDKPLSEIIYQISEVPTDWVAKRSGHDEEYAQNHEPLPVELYEMTKNYYDSKYELEIGKSRSLK